LGRRVPVRSGRDGPLARGAEVSEKAACVYHVTTAKKMARYLASRCILPPVRFFPSEATARRWMRRTGREVVLAFPRPEPSYPLPDHKPALWSPEVIREWEVVAVTEKLEAQK